MSNAFIFEKIGWEVGDSALAIPCTGDSKTQHGQPRRLNVAELMRWTKFKTLCEEWNLRSLLTAKVKVPIFPFRAEKASLEEDVSKSFDAFLGVLAAMAGVVHLGLSQSQLAVLLCFPSSRRPLGIIRVLNHAFDGFDFLHESEHDNCELRSVFLQSVS